MPKHSGVGYSALHRYYYNNETIKCTEFSYKGYVGNNNNFKTKENCQLVCNPLYINKTVEPDNEIIGIVNKCSSKPKLGIHLTFDDGPFIEYTPYLLDTLKKYNIKATFFLVAKQVLLHPNIVKRMIKEGHIIGGHTFTHINIKQQEKLGNSKLIEQEIIDSEKVFKNVTGSRPW